MHKDAWTEPVDLLEMANILGMDVRVERINYSFFFHLKQECSMASGLRTSGTVTDLGELKMVMWIYMDNMITYSQNMGRLYRRLDIQSKSFFCEI